MESIKSVLLIFGLSIIASGIVETFNLTWWGLWLIVIIIIVAYISIIIFLEEGGFHRYWETKKERKRKEIEIERERKRKEIEIERKRMRKEYEKEQAKLIKRQKSTYKNPDVYQDVEEINSTKNDCPNCGRSNGRHDPKCYR